MKIKVRPIVSGSALGSLVYDWEDYNPGYDYEGIVAVIRGQSLEAVKRFESSLLAAIIAVEPELRPEVRQYLWELDVVSVLVDSVDQLPGEDVPVIVNADGGLVTGHDWAELMK